MEHNQGQTFYQKDLMRRDRRAFCEMVIQFGDQKWPPVKILAGCFHTTTTVMNNRLRRFVMAGWVKVGESNQGPWIEESTKPAGQYREVDNDPGTTGSINKKADSDLPLPELEARLEKLRAERDQAEREGRPFDGSKAISKILDKEGEKD